MLVCQCLILALTGCLARRTTIDLIGKKMFMVVSRRNSRDSELTDPRDFFLTCGPTVEVAATYPGGVIGIDGLSMTPDKDLEQVHGASYDAVILVGGPGSTTRLWDNPDATRLAKEAYGSGKMVAALSKVVLARSGILEGRRVTHCNDSQLKTEIREAGAAFTGRRAERDGPISMASGLSAAKKCPENREGSLTLGDTL